MKKGNKNELFNFGKGWGTIIFCLLMFWFYAGMVNDSSNVVAPAVAEKLGETLDTLDMDLNNAMMALASAWVSDSRWPPDPTSPGRFNVRESLDDMYKANNAIKTAMEKGGIAEKRGLYSPNLMETQIKAIDKKLMDIKYFGEE